MCGAVSGAVIALGLAFGRKDEERKWTGAIAGQGVP